MIYQFDSSFNGRVVTELVDPRATKDLYKGLNFPASDIPKQARDLYKVNKVRLVSVAFKHIVFPRMLHSLFTLRARSSTCKSVILI